MKNKALLPAGIFSLIVAGIFWLFASKIAKTFFMPNPQQGGYLGDLEAEDKLENTIGLFYILAFLLLLLGIGLVVYYLNNRKTLQTTDDFAKNDIQRESSSIKPVLKNTKQELPESEFSNIVNYVLLACLAFCMIYAFLDLFVWKN